MLNLSAQTVAPNSFCCMDGPCTAVSGAAYAIGLAEHFHLHLVDLPGHGFSPACAFDSQGQHVGLHA